ncbi:hypothetical protein J2X76_003666 [Neorhizobium sp. 2083]|uniref:hypothetical protein n=1 Tax=Neorhizobium sp. 2083 TaxID=2817762 RepID=UPI002858CF8C|nr:hypothetical protein [Neorhizobium sp. 2083]MDR6818489.1 hypothetical protein [Neorhizobium sp. 2083]
MCRSTQAPLTDLLAERARYFRDMGAVATPELLERALDKIEGLEADLDNAIEVAFQRGAAEWVRLNYPAHYRRLSVA